LPTSSATGSPGWRINARDHRRIRRTNSRSRFSPKCSRCSVTRARAGRFRVRGLVAQRTGKKPPSERTIGRAMALNRQHHGAPPAWTTDRPDPAEPDEVIKDMPYALTHRQRYWFIGAIRSLETAIWQGMRGAPQGATTTGVTPGVIPGPLGEGGNASSLGSRLVLNP
jgi:hypothetical protein